VKLAELAPPATATDDGTVRLVFWRVSATDVPPLGAAPLSVTVQLVFPGVFTDGGLQVNDVTVTGTLLGATLNATVVAANVADV
jgi:hypothetical protein